MNPIVIAGGIIALLYWNSKSKTQTQVSQSDAPIPSPANPSGLDKPTGPSTTSDPIASPANPAGLDRSSEPIPSPANPEVLEKDVERVADEGSEAKDTANYEIVDDGNWSPSPANPKGLEEELMLDSETPATSPANPKGLADVIAPQEYWKKMRSQAIANNPSTEKRYAQSETQWNFITKLQQSKHPRFSGGLSDWAEWIKFKDELGSLRGGIMSNSDRNRHILRFLDKKGLLNDSLIKEYNDWQDERNRISKIAQQAIQDRKNGIVKEKTYPPVLSGRVHMGNGQYADPTKQSDCPLGYKFLNRRGWTGCVSEERYAEVMSEMAKDYPLLPPKQWSQAILLKYAGSLSDKSALTMPTDKLIDLIRENAKDCTNKWCKVINDSFITDSTSFVRERFEFRGVISGKMDENWIAFYPIPVKVAGQKRKKDLPYIMFALSEQEFTTYKDLAKYYKATK